MKIITDCAADIPVAERDSLGVERAPLFIQFPDEEINSEDITVDAFYDRLEAMRPAIPTTAQPSAGLFAEIYRRAASDGSSVLSIHVSSGLSGTINAAATAADQVKAEGITVSTWDSMTLSGGQRFQVLAAALASKAGWALEAILNRLAEIRDRTEVVFTLETLEYLARGGRIGRVQALAGTLLSIKPIIHVDHRDGKYSTTGRARTVTQALTTIADTLRQTYGPLPLWVTVEHGRFAEKAEALAAELKQKLTIAKLETLRIPPVLGVHTGPGIVGVSVVPMSLIEDLM